MPSDYKRISDDRGLDANEMLDRLLTFIAKQTYIDGVHFIFELLQNAEDALRRRGQGALGVEFSRCVTFHLHPDRLEFSHFGQPFNEADVRGITDVLKGTKADDETQIGTFGIGFKSVYTITERPEIHSGDEHFRIEHYIRPYPANICGLKDGETRFIFPLKDPDAFDRIQERLSRLGPRTLLFLRNITEIEWMIEGGDRGIYLREDQPEGNARRVTVIGERQGETAEKEDFEEDWLVFSREVQIPGKSGTSPVEAAFSLSKDPKTGVESIVPIKENIGLRDKRSYLVVYFPTEKETHLGFLIQGPYQTNPARDNILPDDTWNTTLVNETAELISEALPQLRDYGLLTLGLLKALPIKDSDFPPTDQGGTFRPIFDRVRDTLLHQPLLPAHSGGFVSAQQAKLAGTSGLRDLISDAQLQELFKSEHDVKWLTAGLTKDSIPDLWQYLLRKLSIDEVDSDRFSLQISTNHDFISQQTDDWMTKFYSFLTGQSSLWRAPRWKGDKPGPRRNLRIIRLSDGTHVTPFDAEGRPKVYLPPEVETDFPTVKRTIATNEDALKFLKALGLSEPDILAEVTGKILPKYQAGQLIAISEDEHRQDIAKICRALNSVPASKRSSLIEDLKKTPFLRAVNAATGEEDFRLPDAIYVPSPELRLYFYGNPDAWFLPDNFYSKGTRETFHELGLMRTVWISYKAANDKGHVAIRDRSGWHERGLQVFDPGCEIDGLAFALENITTERAAYIWNRLLIPNRPRVHGTVESCTRADYTDSDKKPDYSKMGKLVRDHDWLPDGQGSFHRPSELFLEDLPAEFQQDEQLASALGMRSSEIKKLAQIIDISIEDLDFVRALRRRDPEKLAKLKAEIQQPGSREKITSNGSGKTSSDVQPLNYRSELERTFNRLGVTETDGLDIPPGPAPNPEIRRARIQAEIRESRESEPRANDRVRIVLQRKWDDKDGNVRTFLREQYAGKCQICQDGFTKANGEPYFEGWYLVSYTEAQWIDRPGNVICVCATCCAKFQHGALEADGILAQIEAFKAINEGGDRPPVLAITLCGEDREVRFTERHMMDLQAIVRKTANASSGPSPQ